MISGLSLPAPKGAMISELKARLKARLDTKHHCDFKLVANSAIAELAYLPLADSAGHRDILMAAAAFPPFGQFSRSFLRKHAFSQ
jgi:hypothetical protein